MDPETPDTNPSPETTEDPAVSAEGKHGLKEDFREGAARVFGLAVEAASLLGGSSGEIVDAERDVAEAEAEQFLDRIDGED